jgi:hypothetical protein
MDNKIYHMKKIIQYKTNFYIIEQQIFEPNEIFFERINFIIKNLELDEFTNLKKKSLLSANLKNYGCEYLSS